MNFVVGTGAELSRGHLNLETDVSEPWTCLQMEISLQVIYRVCLADLSLQMY